LIQGLVIRELPPFSGRDGTGFGLWDKDNAPGSLISAACHSAYPGVVEAWMRREAASERIICLHGMLKLVLCDRREGSSSRDEVLELFLGEYRQREVIVPAGVLRGWKAVGDRPALVFLILEGEEGQGALLSREEAGVPYNWDIVMR
jgi:dTDP-4-dehydrorhamnose 3,5-epimerase